MRPMTEEPRVAIVTGANTGLGEETAVGLAALGFRVVMTSRDPAKGEAALARVRERAGSDAVECRPLDLASFASIRAFAGDVLAAHPAVHVLVNNAGLHLSDRRVTAEGFEMTFGVNHLGPFLLTGLLLDRLRSSAPARVVVVSSAAHRRASRGRPFDDHQTQRPPNRGFRVYGESKLANLLFTRELARRLDGSGVTANACHPGLVATRFGLDGDTHGLVNALGRPFVRRVGLSPAQGAITQIWLASAPEVAGRTGGYFVNAKDARPAPAARDDDAARRLWTVSEELVASAGSAGDVT
jgi:NAD(P)-dependent dehydrogenase (short-subunit alcohol dehydrogenase family)